MKPTLVYVVPAADFDAVTNHTLREVRSIGRQYNYSHREIATQTHTIRNVEFVIEIDIAKIIDHMVSRAKHTKALKANAQGGLIRCKATEVKKVSERIVARPLGEGFELVETDARVPA